MAKVKLAREVSMKHTAAIALSLILAGSTCWAHVTVFPTKSTAGEVQTYEFRVPNEKVIFVKDQKGLRVKLDPKAKASPMTKFELVIPDEISVVFFEPQPGWDLELSTDSTGRVSKAIWSGGEIKPLEFALFHCMALNPAGVKKLIWKAVQHFSDGSTEESSPVPTVTLVGRRTRP